MVTGIMLHIGIRSRPPTRIRKKKRTHQDKLIIIPSNTYKTDLHWPHFDEEQRFWEKLQV